MSGLNQLDFWSDRPMLIKVLGVILSQWGWLDLFREDSASLHPSR